jgi:hypothetical protein
MIASLVVEGGAFILRTAKTDKGVAPSLAGMGGWFPHPAAIIAAIIGGSIYFYSAK